MWLNRNTAQIYFTWKTSNYTPVIKSLRTWDDWSLYIGVDAAKKFNKWCDEWTQFIKDLRTNLDNMWLWKTKIKGSDFCEN